MTNPEQDAQRVAEHIAEMVANGLRLGAAGNWVAAVNTMRPLFHQYSADEAYAWMRAMLRTIPREDLACGCGCATRPIVVHLDPDTGQASERDIDDPDVPIGIRTMARIIAAHANGDEDTVRALWNAVIDQRDSEAIAIILQRTLQAAVESQQLRLGAGRPGGMGEPDE